MAAMENTVKPGFFHLNLPINQDKNISHDAVKRKIVDVEHDARRRQNTPEIFAIQNCLGLFKFKLKKYNDALEHFKNALSLDAENLNAMANSIYVLDVLHRKPERRHYQDMLEAFQSQHDIKSRVEARCLAEQAYAFACNIHTDNESQDRYEESNVIFKRALELAGDRVNPSEKDIWKFYMAKNAHKVFDKLCFGERSLQALDNSDFAVELFYDIVTKVPVDPELKWESWRHLGDIFRRIKEKKHLRYVSKYCSELKDYINNPEKCLEKALTIAPNNARLLARCANFIYSVKRNAKEALELLDKSIELDSSEYNFYAFSVRGSVRLKSFKWQSRMHSESSSRFPNPPKKTMLEFARRDLKKAITFRNTIWDVISLTEVLHLLAKCSKEAGHTDKARHYLEVELEYLKVAEESENDCGRLKTLKRAFGRCFFDLGDFQEAIRYFRNCVDLEAASCEYMGYFHELFQCYLCLLQNEPTNKKEILEEMIPLLGVALTKYGSSRLIKHSLSPWRQEYKDDLKVLIDYCKTIPNSQTMLDFLQSDEPSSPVAAPAHQGGTLQDSWEQNVPKSTRETVAGKTGTSGGELDSTLLSQTPHRIKKTVERLPDQRSTADGRSDISEEVTHLTSGIDSMTVKDNTTKMADPQSSATGSRTKKEFDFNVVYAPEQLGWVNDKLLPELEIKRRLNGCTFDRDVVAGSYISRSRVELMNASDVILLILSKYFNKHCTFLLQHALQAEDGRVRKIIPIQKDESEIPKEIRVFTRFDATTEHVDWDKLQSDIKEKMSASVCRPKSPNSY